MGRLAGAIVTQRIVMALSAATLVAATAGEAIAQAKGPAPAQGARAIGVFSSWRVFAHGEAASLLCFAAARPTKQEPAVARRDPPFFYVSTWPADGVKAEVSVRLGYPLRRDSEVTVTVGGSVYKLFVSGDRAYLADATQELKLIDAMRKGGTLVVRGTSQRGTQTTDTYALAGLTQAMQTLATGCK